MIDNKYNMSVNTFKLGSICRSSIQSYSISNKIRFTYYFSVLCTPFVFAYEWFFQCVFQFHFDNAKSCGPFVERERETIGLDSIVFIFGSDSQCSARRCVGEGPASICDTALACAAIIELRWSLLYIIYNTTQVSAARAAAAERPDCGISMKAEQSACSKPISNHMGRTIPLHSIPLLSTSHSLFYECSACSAVFSPRFEWRVSW